MPSKRKATTKKVLADYSKLNIHAAAALVRKHTLKSNADGCVMCTLQPTERGYCQIRIDKVKYYTHKIMLLADRKCGKVAPRMEVSHLCHRKRCVNPRHLTLETALQNKGRIGCMPGGGTAICAHKPKCIKTRCA